MGILLAGPTAEDGKSAYQIAVDNGFLGTEAQWLASLMGVQGLSAYQVALANGFVGTQAQWLASLIGPQGTQGPAGPSGIANVGVAQTWDPDPKVNISSFSGIYCTNGSIVICSARLAPSVVSGSIRLPFVPYAGFKARGYGNISGGTELFLFADPGTNLLNFSGTATGYEFALNFTYLKA